MPKPNWAGGGAGAVSGAAAGAPFGPWGAAIGGTIGGVAGLYGGGAGSSNNSSKSSANSGQRSMGDMRGSPNSANGNFLTGYDPQDYQQTTLGPEQIPLYEQSVNAGLRPGAGGAFGDSADYYRNLLSDNSADYNAFAAPQMRQFNEEIIPGLSEQFAGMGSGGLSSSGFRNAAVNAGTDLSERLGAIRANLRMQGAQGLFQAGQQGLQKHLENIHVPGQPGLIQGAASGIGQAGTQLAGSGGNSQGVANNNPGIAPPNPNRGLIQQAQNIRG